MLIYHVTLLACERAAACGLHTTLSLGNRRQITEALSNHNVSRQRDDVHLSVHFSHQKRHRCCAQRLLAFFTRFGDKYSARSTRAVHLCEHALVPPSVRSKKGSIKYINFGRLARLPPVMAARHHRRRIWWRLPAWLCKMSERFLSFPLAHSHSIISLANPSSGLQASHSAGKVESLLMLREEIFWKPWYHATVQLPYL